MPKKNLHGFCAVYGFSEGLTYVTKENISHSFTTAQTLGILSTAGR